MTPIPPVAVNPQVHPDAGPNPENVQSVRDFCDAWNRMEIDAILSYVADDVLYHNLPLPPIEGKEAMRGFLEAFFGQLKDFEIHITHAFSQGQYVMTERIDDLVEEDRTTSVPVGGVFVFDEDGKIARWHEYFDLKALVDNSGLQLA